MISPDYRSGASLHEQISSQFREMIFSGQLCENEKLPSVRETALRLAVNPNTVMRAYRDLENEGLILCIRGKGNFVAPTPKKDDARVGELYLSLGVCVRELRWRGEGAEKISQIVNDIFEEG